jgi:hypothetical protein
VGPRRPASRPRARRGASVLYHHHHRVHRHHNHHHHRVRRRHHHLGVIFPRGTSSSSNNNSSSSNGRPASRVAGKSKAPSECNPFPLIYLSCRRVLTLPLLGTASSPSAPKVAPPPPPADAAETAPPGSHAPATGPAAVAPTSSSVAAVTEGVPTAPTATAASMTAMPSSTSSAAAEEAPTAPAPAIKGDAGGASSSIPPPTLEETEVVFGRRLLSGAELEAAPVPLPQVMSQAHQALHETEAAILREWEALGAKHQCLSDWHTQLEERTKATSCQFASEWSELERDHKDYKKDLQKVYTRELEASRKEKRLAKREEALNQREEVVIELSAKLSAMNGILEEQRI